VIFVDTNVFMYAVGREHRHRDDARSFFFESLESPEVLVSSAEVLLELLYAYLHGNRIPTLDAALRLARGRLGAIWQIERDDIDLARSLSEQYPGIGARDLIHVACCTRRGVDRIKTYDPVLEAIFKKSEG
jgi:predicted nucleic acid-binding protein